MKAANDNGLFYTYIWRDADGCPFYVGKGTGSRAYSTKSRSTEFKDIYALGGCTVEIVDWFIHESQAHASEINLNAAGLSTLNGERKLVTPIEAGWSAMSTALN